MATLASSDTRVTAAPLLRAARLSDYEAIKRLGAAHSFAVVSFDDWRHLWQDNPLWERVGKDWPIGWVLEAASGEIVGSFSNVPSHYEFRGEHLVAANSRAWVVAPAYRGFALWLLDEYFSQPSVDLCISTTAGPLALPSLTEFADRIPVGQWDKHSYWITGHRAVAKRGLERRSIPFADKVSIAAAVVLRLRDAPKGKPVPKRSRSITVEAAGGFDSRFDAFWRDLRQLHSERLLGLRDSQALSWHFSLPLREGRLWILIASRNQRIVAYCICKRQPRSLLRTMRLIDYQTIEQDVDPLPDLLRAALEMCGAERIDVLDNPGYGVPKMQILDRCAPHCRTLDTWPFFYRAGDASLARELRKESSWDPSVFDGDASLE